MKKIALLTLCLTIFFSSCTDDEKKTKKKEVETTQKISVETSKGSIKADDKGNLDVKIKDK